MKKAAILVLLVVASALAGSGGGAQSASSACASPPRFNPGSLGAVAYWQSGSLRVVDVASGQERIVYTPARRTVAGTPLAFSRDGRWIAAGSRLIPVAGGEPCPMPPGRGAFDEPGFDSTTNELAVSNMTARSLSVIDHATGRSRLLYSSPSERVGPPTNERWSPDGRWVLFQTDPFGGASIAADGLPLLAVPAAGGRPIRIEPSVLRAADFVQPCGRRSIVISAGFDRYVSAGKHIDIASPPSWKPVHVSHDPSRSWYFAACSPDGKLVAATVTPNRDEGRFDSAERSIWLLAADGSSRRLLVGKQGDGISDEYPRWSRDGRFVLYLEHPARAGSHAGIYLLDLQTGKRRGPLAEVNSGLGYYGLRDWGAIAPWYQP